jgi:hypothetical protein
MSLLPGAANHGSAVCSEKYDEGWWKIVPTLDGEFSESPGHAAALACNQ